MSYLKLIANAVWAGWYGSILLAFLFMFLNEDLAGGGSAPRVLCGLVLALALVFVPLLATVFPTLFVFVRFFAARRLGITWLDFKAIVWLCVAVLGSMCVIDFHNFQWASSLQSPHARDALRLGLECMTIAWLIAVTLCCMAQVRPGAAGHPFRRAAAVILLLPLPVLAWLTWQAGREPKRTSAVQAAAPAIRSESEAEPRTLLIVGVQAASMNEILPLVAARELPEFERIIKEGASTPLNSIAPCSSLAAWTTLATGMPPWSTGVKDGRVHELRYWPGGGPGPALQVVPRWIGVSALVRAGFLRDRAGNLGPARRPTIWEMLRGAGADVRVMGWPPGAEGTARADRPAPEDARVAARLTKIIQGSGGAGTPAWPEQDLDWVRRSVMADLAARDSARAGLKDLGAGPSTRVLAVFFPGLGGVMRKFLRYHRPEEFGDVTPEEAARYGKVVERYYAFVDELVAELDEAAGGRASIMIVSAHGVVPVNAWVRFLRKLLPASLSKDSGESGSWRDGPDGVLLLKGEGVAAGAKLEEADIKDVVPTALYMLGLPIERDLRGGMLRRLFSRQYLEAHPLQLVPGRGALE